MAAAATTAFDRGPRQNLIAAVYPSSDQVNLEELDRQQQESIRVSELMQEARDRFRDSVNASQKQRAEMLEDLKFYCGEQWDVGIQRIRDQQGRPSLTLNRIPGFVSHVVNNMRQARPQIKIDPIAGGADEEIAEIRQGLIRHIELNSRSEIAYDTGFKNMAIMGLGYIRVLDCRQPKSFDLDLKIEWVSNSFTVYEDPAAMLPDWSDGRYKFVVEDLSPAEFKRKYPNKQPASMSEFSSLGDQQNNWIIGGKIRIAEYFHIEEEDDVLIELADGTVGYQSEIGDQVTEQNIIVQQVDERRPYVQWTLMYGLGILKERRWEGKYIPIIPVIGDQTDIEGERVIVGMVRHAREAQRMFNYMYSCFVEACALAPKAPFVAEFSQIEEFYDLYKNANSQPQGVLPYRGKSIDGQLVGPPHRETAEPPIQAFVEGLKLSDQNLKSVFRIFEASLGQKGPQESGIAINSRKVESDLATYDWIDNFTRALRYLGMVLNDLLQYYYNRPGRIVQVLQEDLTRKPTVMNQAHDVEGEEKIYDLSQGEYATTVSTGPTIATRRQEFAASALDLAKVYPPIMQVAGPQIVRAMDWPDKDLIADQLEKAMPPELRTKNKDEEGQEDPEQIKQAAQAMQQQIQQLTELLNKATDQKEIERQSQQFELLKTQIVEQNKLGMAEMKVGLEEARFLNEKLFAEFERVRAVLEPMALAQKDPNSPPSSQSPAGPASPPSPPGGGGNTAAEVGIGA